MLLLSRLLLLLLLSAEGRALTSQSLEFPMGSHASLSCPVANATAEQHVWEHVYPNSTFTVGFLIGGDPLVNSLDKNNVMTRTADRWNLRFPCFPGGSGLYLVRPDDHHPDSCPHCVFHVHCYGAHEPRLPTSGPPTTRASPTSTRPLPALLTTTLPSLPRRSAPDACGRAGAEQQQPGCAVRVTVLAVLLALACLALLTALIYIALPYRDACSRNVEYSVSQPPML